MPTLRGDFGHVVGDDRIYVLGGWRRGGRDLVPSVERYDPGSDTWSQLPPLSEPKWQFGTVYYEGRILVIGGLPVTLLRLLVARRQVCGHGAPSP